MRILIKLILLFLIFFLISCTTEKAQLQQKQFSQLPGWRYASLKPAFNSFARSCPVLLKKDKNKYILPSNILFAKYENWQNICTKINGKAHYNEIQIKEYFENNFIPYAVLDKQGNKGLFTGYHEIVLNGSLKKTKKFKYPIYKKPPELKGKDVYYSHAEINSGFLNKRKLELLWVDDPIRLFFLHIQGSGIVNLPNGKIMRIGYNGQNNHKYYAIGKYLYEQGFIAKEKISAQSISAWLYANPIKAKKIMEMNPSYIFFKAIKGEGPIGALGVPLTPFASLAVDKSKIPLGVPLWLDTELSATPNKPKKRMHNLLISQDTGGAIKGIIRGDIFFGSDKIAEELAGYQKGLGSYYILLPK